MSNSNVTAPTQFLQTSKEKYDYCRFGKKSKYPLLFLQNLTGTLDNWDPAVTDPLAADHDVILFEYAGVGRSTGKVPPTVGGMTADVLEFLDVLSLIKNPRRARLLSWRDGGTTNRIGAAIDRPKDDSRRDSTARW